MENIKKSISQIINERITSPFYGTFIISWLIWNWRIIYLTIFISEKSINKDKITYITENFSDINFLITYPIISTLILITVIPYLTNRAYWVSLLYNQWKVNKRNEVQKKQLLSIEQSINIREQIKSEEKRFEDLLEDKNLRIKQLETEIELTKDSGIVTENKTLKTVENSFEKLDLNQISLMSKKITGNAELNKTFDTLSSMILHRYRIRDLSNSAQPSNKSLNFFIINDIVEQDEEGKFSFTRLGKKIAQNILNKD